jgi:hypothetical protein
VKVVEYPDAIHSFHVFPEIADTGEHLEEVSCSSSNTGLSVSPRLSTFVHPGFH